jgi:nicotinamidase-related amidase
MREETVKNSKDLIKFLKNNKDSTAVVVVDMECDYVWSEEEEIYLDGAGYLVQNQIKILKLCKKEDIPVAVLNDVKGKTIPEIAEVAFSAKRAISFSKLMADGFFRTGLDDQLKSWGAKAILLMGIWGDRCVMETAKVALEKNYKVVTSNSVIDDSTDHFPWYRANTIFFEAET